MALIPCSECGREVSDKASSCPNCGSPTTARPVQQVPVQPEKKKRGCLIAIVIFALLVIIIVVINSIVPDSTTPSDPSTPSPSPTTSENRQSAEDFLAEAKTSFENGDYENALDAALWARWTYSLDKPSKTDTLYLEIEEAITAHKQPLLEAIEPTLNSKYDDMSEVTYRYATSKIGEISSSAFTPLRCYMYTSEKDGYSTSLRFTIGFHASDWIFTDNIKLKTENNEVNIAVSYSDRKTEVSSGIYEWIDIVLTDLQLVEFGYLLEDDSIKVRFSGDQYYKDVELTSAQVDELRTMLEYYTILTY